MINPKAQSLGPSYFSYLLYIMTQLTPLPKVNLPCSPMIQHIWYWWLWGHIQGLAFPDYLIGLMQFMIFNKNPVLSIELVENVGLASAEVPKGFFIHLRCIGTCYVGLEDIFICQFHFFHSFISFFLCKAGPTTNALILTIPSKMKWSPPASN